MTIARVASNTWLKATSNGGSVSKAFGVNVSAASLLVSVGVAQSGTTTGSFSDDNTNSWTAYVNAFESVGIAERVYIGYAKNSNAGATTVTFTRTTSTVCAIAICEYTGADTTSPADGSNGTTDGSGSPHTMSPGSIATTSAGVMIGVAGYYPTANPTVNASFTDQGILASAYESKIQDYIHSGGTITADWVTQENYWACVAASFKEASGGGGSRPVKMAGEWGGYAGSSGGFAG